MRPIEQQMIRNLMDPNLAYESGEALMTFAQEEPLGTVSLEFINHPVLNAYIEKKTYYDDKNYFMLWLRIVDYLSNKSDIALAQEKLSQVEIALKECLQEMTPEAKACGVAMLPRIVANATFMRNLYSLNDDDLSSIFLKYLPAPRANVFKGQEIPELISKREQDSTKAIMNVLERNGNDLTSVEKKMVKVQRQFRAKKREEENLQRLPVRYKHRWEREDEKMTPDENAKERGKQFAKDVLADANKPYHPKCDDMLAKRIMKAAKEVTLFSTVSHLTAASALESIFNEGLYGRQSMITRYMPFRPAALFQSDIDNGDANAVCLGANEIDPQARHGIELQFDAKKLAENNPCVFYKQRDLGFDPKKIRHVSIGELDLHFSHTGRYRCQPEDTSSLVLSDRDGYRQYAFSKVITATLIADNTKEMHQILTLNFFRFIDGLMRSDWSESSYEKERIYAALSELSDDELVETLLKIGKNMTDTMEFNFYGVYKIDFSALLTIKNDDPSYRLDLPGFIDELKAGNSETLNEAMVKLPELFNSYRFIDHLLSNTDNETVIAALQEKRATCTLPAWMEEVSNGLKLR